MANDYFQFKKFMIRQDKCAMKVGTDGVLLGAWASVTNCHTILDVGTGTGLIALMLAQRSEALIDGIDIDNDAYQQAKENISGSIFTRQIRIDHQSFEEYVLRTEKKYDLMVSNPPYFNHSLKSPDEKRTTARHTTTLSFTDIIEKGKPLLTPEGRVALIIPYEQETELVDTVHENNMYIVRRTNVFPTPESKARRMLVELSVSDSPLYSEDDLVIEEARHSYTTAYNSLTGDFYLSK